MPRADEEYLAIAITQNPPRHERSDDEENPWTSYVIGNDPARWRMDVPNFERVRVAGIYPGIDAVYYGRGSSIEYDFVVSPGADPGVIRMRTDAAATIDERTGDLLLRAGAGTLRQHAPHVYQETKNGRREIEARYQLARDGAITFALGRYDRDTTLIIDPVLQFSTFLGGSDRDAANGVAVDGQGNTIIVGQTQSTTFVGLSRNDSETDAFIVKLDSNGALVFKMRLGGSKLDAAMDVATDRAGNIYVTGFTHSGDFPTKSAFRSTLSGLSDAYLLKMNGNGTEVVYATYFGGSKGDHALKVSVDAAGNAYVSGTTFSNDLPMLHEVQTYPGNAIAQDASSR